MQKLTKALLMAVCAACLEHSARAAETYSFSTVAGSATPAAHSIDGSGSAAQFYALRGVSVDDAGNVYVADSSNHTIRKVSSAGVVTTLAGTAGSAGATDGSGTAAKFSEPFATVVDGSGNVFVADTNNNAIRRITPSGAVTTLAGGNGMGSADGAGVAAKFSEPRGIAIDGAGNLYVTDYMNHTIRKVSSAGVVTTLAGSAGSSGSSDGQGSTARFMSPQGIAIDSAGNLYVADAGNRSIRKVSAAGLVTTFASGAGGALGEPRGIAIDASGTLWVADYSAHVLRRVSASGVVSTYAGTVSTPGSGDGVVSAALFYSPNGIAVDNMNNLYVADTLNHTLRKITPTGTVTTLAGQAGRSSSVDGTSALARFEDPYALAIDGAGNVYVADATDHSIRKLSADGTVSTFAGKAGSFGSADGMGAAARFFQPMGIAADSAGNVYVADTGNLTIRKITPAGTVTTLAGSPGLSGATDGSGSSARFSSPYGVAIDSQGVLYVAESTGVVRKVTASGVVSTLAGSAGSNGLVDGTGAAARFGVLFDLTVDGSGNVYISDHGNHAVRKITAAGVVTTLAGSGTAGNVDGVGTAARFKFPSGIGADAAGNVFVADTDNQIIRKIDTTGAVTTVGGSGNIGSTDGVGTAASFYNPKDVAVDSDGHIYVVDRGNRTLRKGSLSSASGGATFSLGNPAAGSTVSGVGVVSGYHCTATDIEIRIDGISIGRAGAGTTLLGTQGVCGRTDTGFSLLYNFNNLASGPHTIDAYANGVLFASNAVTTLKSAGTAWLAGASKSVSVADFPTPGITATLDWTQSYQNFVVTGLSAVAAGPAPSAMSLSPAANIGSLGTPADASTVSGVGVISGWHCTSRNIEVKIDGNSIGLAGAGTTLMGTQGVCGRTDTGYSLLYNFNNLANGLHEVAVYADGALLDRHQIRTVQSGNTQWLSGITKTVTVADFPATGNRMQLDWVQSYQAFLVTAWSSTGGTSAVDAPALRSAMVLPGSGLPLSPRAAPMAHPYPAGSIAAQSFDRLNEIRRAAGLLPASYDAAVGLAAQNHAEWYAALPGDPASGDPHLETPGESGFTGVTVMDRCRDAAASLDRDGPDLTCVEALTHWPKEIPSASAASEALGTSLALLQHALAPAAVHLGIGHALVGSGGHVLSVVVGLGEEPSLSAEAISVFPYDGMRDVPYGTEFAPLVLIRVPTETMMRSVRLSLTGEGAQDGEIAVDLFIPGEVFRGIVLAPGIYAFQPHSPLQMAATYRVRLVIQTAAEPIRKTWSFTTAMPPRPSIDSLP